MTTSDVYPRSDVLKVGLFKRGQHVDLGSGVIGHLCGRQALHVIENVTGEFTSRTCHHGQFITRTIRQTDYSPLQTKSYIFMQWQLFLWLNETYYKVYTFLRRYCNVNYLSDIILLQFKHQSNTNDILAKHFFSFNS